MGGGGGREKLLTFLVFFFLCKRGTRSSVSDLRGTMVLKMAGQWIPVTWKLPPFWGQARWGAGPTNGSKRNQEIKWKLSTPLCKLSINFLFLVDDRQVIGVYDSQHVAFSWLLRHNLFKGVHPWSGNILALANCKAGIAFTSGAPVVHVFAYGWRMGKVVQKYSLYPFYTLHSWTEGLFWNEVLSIRQEQT